MYNETMAYEKTMGVGFAAGAVFMLMACVIMICITWSTVQPSRNAKGI